MPLADEPMTLSAGSMVRYSFADLVDAAARAGFAAISVTKRLRHVARRREDLTDREMAALVRGHGLTVAEVEGTPGWLGGPEPSDDRVLGLEEALDLACALGAASVLAYHDGRDRSHAELVGDFAAACDRAAERSLTLALEFLPWTPVPTLASALALVEEAGRPNGRVVLDSWHHRHSPYSGQSWELGPAHAYRISCFQLVDARPPETDDPVRETTFGRRAPGTGTLELTALVAELDAAGLACPVAVEVYDETLAGLDARAYASVLADAARRVLTTR